MMRRLDLLTGLSDTDGGGADLTVSKGVTVSSGPSATNNAFGSWVEVIASAAVDANYLVLNLSSGGNDDNQFVINVGIGAAGSEVIAAEGVCLNTAPNEPTTIYIPTEILRGDRVSIQVATPVDYRVIWVTCEIVQTRAAAHRNIVHSSYIENGSNPNQPVQVIATPTLDNTWSAWAQIAASMPEEGDLFVGSLISPDRTNGQGNENCLVQLGVGAAGLEVPICEPVQTYFPSYVRQYAPFTIAARIPRGERLAIRVQSDTISLHTAYTLELCHTVFGE